MANQDVQDGRAWFETELRKNASKKSIPIDAAWNDVARRDESHLEVTSGGKKKELWIDDRQLVSNKPNSYLVQCIEEIMNSLS